MIIADTSIWIDFLKGNPHMRPFLVREIELFNIIALECIFGELLQGIKSPKEGKIIMEYWEALPKIDEGGLWIEAGSASSKNHFLEKGVGLIDAFIVSAARKSKALVWSLDKKLNSVLHSSEKFSPD